MIAKSRLFVLLLTFFVYVAPAFAQTYALTPQQQAMLDQLPAGQKQQALSALQELQQNANGNSSVTSSSLNEPIPSPAQMTGAPDFREMLPREAVAEPGSRLIIVLSRKDGLSRQEQATLENDPALLAIEGRNYFVLSESGELILPGVNDLVLLGLSGDEIQERLSAEPELDRFNVSVSLLGDGMAVEEPLKAFGYDFFESGVASFESVTTGPVPPGYTLGPGDSVRVQLFGNVNGIYEFEISRDGILSLPELGPLNVAGLSFSEFRSDVENRVKEMLIGTQVSVSMGQLRSIRLFVLGDVNRPGSYVVSSLATISSALHRSGGISRVGSLRNIQLKRTGRSVASLDLYALLLQGDNSKDVVVQSGDVIFVPPVGPQVVVEGAVKRPGIYETREGTTIADLVEIAGGFGPDAYPEGVRVERINAGNERRIVSLNLELESEIRQKVLPGDRFTVPKILPELKGAVELQGHVQRPGAYQWRNGMRLSDLLSSELDLKPGADAEYLLVRREDPKTRRIQVVSASLKRALQEPLSPANLLLQPKDTVHAFSLALGRQRVVQRILEQLELQSRFDEPYGVVSVVGKVRAPGDYPLEPGMRISDLLRAGGSLAEDAYSLKAELARYEIVNGEYRDSEVIDVDLAAVLRGEAASDLMLGAHDNLRINSVPDWDRLWSVRLEGEVRFPGDYRIRDGETLSQLIVRAGGLTNEAFPDGAIFLREALREREQDQIDLLARRLEADLTSLSLETLETTGSQTLSTGRELLTQLKETEALGRLVIDLKKLVAISSDGDSSIDVALRDGDRLLVPKKVQEVTVIGEAQQNTSHLFEDGLSRSDYINLSGGFTRRADKKLIYVVRANGAVEAGGGSRWLGRSKNVEIRPGDTIVVPLDTNRMRPLTFWGNVTQILYQGAIAIAAVRTFDN